MWFKGCNSSIVIFSLSFYPHLDILWSQQENILCVTRRKTKCLKRITCTVSLHVKESRLRQRGWRDELQICLLALFPWFSDHCRKRPFYIHASRSKRRSSQPVEETCLGGGCVQGAVLLGWERESGCPARALEPPVVDKPRCSWRLLPSNVWKRQWSFQG